MTSPKDFLDPIPSPERDKVEEMRATVSISKPHRGVVYAWEGEVDELRKLLHASEKRAEELERQLGECSGGYETLEKELAESRSSLARVVEALKLIMLECENSITGTMAPHYYLARIHSYVRCALHRSQGE